MINRVVMIDTVAQFATFFAMTMAGVHIYMSILAMLFVSFVMAYTVHQKVFVVLYRPYIEVIGHEKMMSITKYVFGFSLPLLAFFYYAVATGGLWISEAAGFGLSIEQIVVGLIVGGGLIGQWSMGKALQAAELANGVEVAQ